MRFRVLDLFCGGGGSAIGIKRACPSAEIWGIDISPQSEYPFWFMQADVEKLTTEFVGRFDFVWASPLCQAFSQGSRYWRRRGYSYPDLIPFTRSLVKGHCSVIENVLSAPLRRDLMLCGEMFGLRVIRHRIFELSGFTVDQPEHLSHRGLAKDGVYVTVAGTGGNDRGHNYTKLCGMEGASKLEVWQAAMGIEHITNLKSLREAVPPAYSEYIFGQFLQSRRRARETGNGFSE